MSQRNSTKMRFLASVDLVSSLKRLYTYLVLEPKNGADGSYVDWKSNNISDETLLEFFSSDVLRNYLSTTLTITIPMMVKLSEKKKLVQTKAQKEMKQIAFISEENRRKYLQSRTVKDLVELAERRKVRYSGLRKAELIESILNREKEWR